MHKCVVAYTFIKLILNILFLVTQINTRYEKLKNIYKKWQKQNFPDKKKKDEALKILKKQEKENKALKKKNEKNEKKQSKASNLIGNQQKKKR